MGVYSNNAQILPTKTEKGDQAVSQAYSAQKMFKSDAEAEVNVQSAKCHYLVWLNEDECTLRGPGVRESGSLPHIGGKMDDEDFAVLIVLLFENGLWPMEEI